MSWKKNAISYLMWFLYASLVTAALVSLGGLYCAEAGIVFGWGVLCVVAYIGLAGVGVFLLRKSAPFLASFAGKRKGVLLAAEIVLVLVLLALGLTLRISGMEGITQVSEYYEAAKVAAGREIPQVVHGAVYFYLQVLHTLFTLLGNHYTGGIWLQTIFQLLGSLFLFLAVRKLAGRIAGVFFWGFCMCGPYMIAGSLVLSPETLYFALFSMAAYLIASAGRKAKKPVVLLCLSVMAAFCCYIDIFGIMLLFLLILKVLDYEKKNTYSGRRAETILLCLAVFVVFILGLMLNVFSDALLSGKSFLGVTQAWLRLYSPEGFRLPVSVGSAGAGMENLILFGSMIFGVFGFWCDRKQERISPWIAGAGLLILGMCYGILTNEMPGFHYLYLFLVLLAGIGLEQCLQPACAAQEGESGKDSAVTTAPEESGKDAAVTTAPEESGKDAAVTTVPEESGKDAAAMIPPEKGQGSTERIAGTEAPPGEPEKTAAVMDSPEKGEGSPEESEGTGAMSGEPEKTAAVMVPPEENEGAAASKALSEKGESSTEESGAEDKESTEKQNTVLASEGTEGLKADWKTLMAKPDALKAELEVLEKKLQEIAEREEAERKETEKKSEEALNELEREKALKEEFRQEAVRRREEQEPAEQKTVKYIENPLPLPRKHKKRVMEYPRHISEEDDFDHPVDENDDFDI